MSLITTLFRVYSLGRAMHPSLSINHLKHQIILMARTLVFISDIQKWYETSDNPLLTDALKRFPLISGAMYWPYINHAWPMKHKLATIDQHYRMLGGSAAIIAHSTFQEVELSCLDEEYSGLRVVLDKAPWFLREGEIVLNLFINDQRFYSIAFTLGIESGQPLIFVGAIQGSNSDTALDIYRKITHSLHGMRPRDLLMVALKLLCEEMSINRIWAISSDYRQHVSPYFGDTHKERVPYNEVWLEHGGTQLENGFFEIHTTVNKKCMEEIPTRKRATYRRRYQMLDKLAIDIKNNCTYHAMQPTAKYLPP